MATHASARKRHRQSLRRHERNQHQLTTVRNAVRRVHRAVQEGDPELPQRLRAAERLLRRAGSKGVLHKKTVSRTVSRLSKLVQRAR
jgi:small subunit ribosomal protein S20